ncbi:MAG: protein-disulfide reductase DsbD family protein [Beijerinckiaceae bacterium]|nr:protein-disulfide reductase DsbD family protein [Beijerinckiaceae bacterium]
MQARLVSAVEGTGDLGIVPLGLEVKLDGDWKTYWRSPGDAGLPPQLDWAGSANLQSATLLYPAPKRLTLLGLQTFGYKHHVIFPLDVHPTAPGQALDLKLKLDLLVCATLCVPHTFNLALNLPAGAAPPGPEAQSIAKARAAVPTSEGLAPLTVTSATDVSDQGGPALEIKAHALDGFEAPDVIAEITPALSLGLPRITLSTDRHDADFIIPLAEKLPPGALLQGRDVVVTLADGDRAVEKRVDIAKGAAVDRAASGPSLLSVLAIALLGGLILNVMPCVLPVLSLKLLATVRHSGQSRAYLRASFLAAAAGIIVSFLGIAGALIALRTAGRTIGWGLQFQEPAFIAGMAAIVTLFACNVFGLFEVPLPRFIANMASSRLGPDVNLAGHFITGVFATLLATPCTAPFLGTAVGFALTGGPLEILSIFLALGIGLALPYFVAAALPGFAARLPKPGRWMIWVKQALAVPLVATAVWLLSILAAQAGLLLAGLVAALLVAIAVLLFFRSKAPISQRGFAMPAVTAFVLGAILLPGLAGRAGLRAAAVNDGIAWRDFDRAGIKSLVSQGKTVFVDVTADWCLTCQANARLVLAQDAIAGRLNTQAVSMRADWTRPDSAISAYLAQYGRYGIPFNIVYGPGAPSGIVLPELLSAGDVAGALDKAEGVERHSSLTYPRSP